MKKLLALAALCAVLCANSGCATLERHPVATGVAIGLIVGSIALSSQHEMPQSIPPTRRVGLQQR